MSNYGFTSAGTSYDDEDRLSGFARASGTFTQSWSLTSVGDWNSITTNGTAQNRTHGPTHELLTAGGQNVTTDVKGNITLLPTTLTTSGVAMAVGYDFDNKLKSADVDNNGSNDVTFQYDALGRRVARQGTSGSFVYVQHDQQTIADYGYGDAPSSPTHRYVYASYIDEPVVRKAAGTSGTIHYYHRNQQFSITAVTTSSGSVAERYAYTAYGQPTILDASGSVLSSSAINNRYTYTGREWDQTLGLYHFRARWMSGLAGRFMGRDPIGYADGNNQYSLFVRSTLSLIDPSGLCGCKIASSSFNTRTSCGITYRQDLSTWHVGRDFDANYEFTNQNGHACGCCKFQQYKGENWKSLEVKDQITGSWHLVMSDSNNAIAEDCITSPDGTRHCYGDGVGGEESLSNDGCSFSMRDTPGFAFTRLSVPHIKLWCGYREGVPFTRKCGLRYKDCLSYGHRITDRCGGGRVVDATWHDLGCCTVELEIDFEDANGVVVIESEKK